MINKGFSCFIVQVAQTLNTFPLNQSLFLHRFNNTFIKLYLVILIHKKLEKFVLPFHCKKPEYHIFARILIMVIHKIHTGYKPINRFNIIIIILDRNFHTKPDDLHVIIVKFVFVRLIKCRK